MSSPNKQKLYTPKLKIRYISLAVPFFYNESDTKGKYSVTLVGTPSDVSEFQEKMEIIHEELISTLCTQEGKRLKRIDPLGGIYPEEDKEGNLTGNFLIKCSHTAQGVNKAGKSWVKKPVVVDAKGQPLSEEIIARIGWGSVVKCSFDARAYLVQGKVGITYDLRATQLITPLWYDGSGTSSDFADQVEEGYTAASAANEDGDF